MSGKKIGVASIGVGNRPSWYMASTSHGKPARALSCPASYFIKTPPKQFTDNEVRTKTGAFIRGDEQH